MTRKAIEHEMALRSAFQNLLAETARAKNWTLVPELSIKIRGRSIRPDGTLRDDEWPLPRGYWEAKDTADALDDEIRLKVGKGYPLVNTIFEDTRRKGSKGTERKGSKGTERISVEFFPVTDPPNPKPVHCRPPDRPGSPRPVADPTGPTREAARAAPARAGPPA
jgi:hypothetical protein